MDQRNYEMERIEIINHTFECMRKSKKFEIQSSGGKQTWEFKYDSEGDLVVRPPMHLRYTKVLHPASTLVAIAKSKEFFEMAVRPLPAVVGDDEIKGLQLMIRIEAPCFAY